MFSALCDKKKKEEEGNACLVTLWEKKGGERRKGREGNACV